MLRELSIKNVAVIENTNIVFNDGLNVLTGETGAGKSIIIDSINMILGERTNKDFVRHGTEKAMVQAVFDINDEVKDVCDELDIDTEDDTIILSRTITSEGKSTARINGMAVPLSSMRDVAGLLVNIHGQHDNQALLSPSKHINFVDSFAANEKELNEYSVEYNKLKEIRAEIEKLSSNERDKSERADLLRYQINEISSANLYDGEYEELISTRDEIQNSEKISDGISRAYSLLYESETSPSAYDMVSDAVSSLESLTEYSDVLKEAYQALNDAMYSIEDAAHSVREYADGVEYDKEVLDDTMERIDLINKLKRKYGDSIEKILEYCESAKTELDGIDHADEKLEELRKAETESNARLLKLAEKLTKTRTKAAAAIEDGITKSLHELNMEQAVFGVCIEQNSLTKSGADDVSFVIRTNSGEPMKPLSKIASGGELSRVMLALKTILTDSVDTLIFDEIDTGVSGLAAQKIAEKLYEISCGKQVLCITHLPQLASMADHHYLIEKHTTENMAQTTVAELFGDEQIKELARITGGELTDISKQHASELKESCRKFKNTVNVK